MGEILQNDHGLQKALNKLSKTFFENYQVVIVFILFKQLLICH